MSVTNLKTLIMKKTLLSLLFSSVLILTTGCSNEETESFEEAKIYNSELLKFFNDISNGSTVASKSNNSNKGGNSPTARPGIWVDCDQYVALVVPATFDSANGNFDELYMMPGGMFYNGIPLISDSGPGDNDYNGGRWHMNVLKDSVDPSKYYEVCTDQELDTEDFYSTDIYFACPVLPIN